MIDNKTLYFIGLLFFGIAAVLTVRELQLGVGWSISLLLIAVLVLSEILKESGKTTSLILFAVAGLITPIGYFAVRNEVSFYVSIIVYFAGSLFLAARVRPHWHDVKLPVNTSGNERSSAEEAAKIGNLEAGAITFAAVISSMSFLWATYFRYLTSMQDEFVARRLVFTLFLVLVGIVLSVLGRSKSSQLIGISGIAYLGSGVAKALAYDTTHLTGFLRIGVFAGGGIILLIGAGLLKKKGA